MSGKVKLKRFGCVNVVRILRFIHRMTCILLLPESRKSVSRA